MKVKLWLRPMLAFWIGENSIGLIRSSLIELSEFFNSAISANDNPNGETVFKPLLVAPNDDNSFDASGAALTGVSSDEGGLEAGMWPENDVGSMLSPKYQKLKIPAGHISKDTLSAERKFYCRITAIAIATIHMRVNPKSREKLDFYTQLVGWANGLPAQHSTESCLLGHPTTISHLRSISIDYNKVS